MHMIGYFKEQLSSDEKQELLEVIDTTAGVYPPDRSHHPHESLCSEIWPALPQTTGLSKSPSLELQLRNHVWKRERLPVLSLFPPSREGGNRKESIELQFPAMPCRMRPSFSHMIRINFLFKPLSFITSHCQNRPLSPGTIVFSKTPATPAKPLGSLPSNSYLLLR